MRAKSCLVSAFDRLINGRGPFSEQGQPGYNNAGYCDGFSVVRLNIRNY